MRYLLLFALVPALMASIAGAASSIEAPDLPETGTPVDEVLAGSQVNATVSAQANDVTVQVDPDDLGLYMRASLPGPGFSHSVSGQAPEADLADPTGGDQEGQGWGPAVPVRMPEPVEVGAAVGLATLGAAAYAAFRWRYLGMGFVMPLYSRLSRSELLENDTRSRLLEVISEEPGLSLQELAGKTDAGWGTTVYHLQRLEQAGFIKSRKQGHHRRFYTIGEVGQDEVEALGMLRNETPRKIAQYLVQDPGCNQKAICQALDISPSLAHKYLKRMEEQNLLTSEREWRSKHYTPDERLANLVEQAA